MVFACTPYQKPAEKIAPQNHPCLTQINRQRQNTQKLNHFEKIIASWYQKNNSQKIIYISHIDIINKAINKAIQESTIATTINLDNVVVIFSKEETEVLKDNPFDRLHSKYYRGNHQIAIPVSNSSCENFYFIQVYYEIIETMNGTLKLSDQHITYVLH